MLNGSALLSFLGSGFTHIFQVNRLYESKDISMNTMSLSVDVRRSKMPLSESGNEEYKQILSSDWLLKRARWAHLGLPEFPALVPQEKLLVLVV